MSADDALEPLHPTLHELARRGPPRLGSRGPPGQPGATRAAKMALGAVLAQSTLTGPCEPAPGAS